MTKQWIIELDLPSDGVLVSLSCAVLISICETEETLRPLATCLRQNNDFLEHRNHTYLFYAL
jgi:hypothetical protein